MNIYKSIKIPFGHTIHFHVTVYVTVLYSPCLQLHTHTAAICLLVLTSLPVYRSAAVKATDLTNIVSVLQHTKLISLHSPFTFHSSFFFYRHSTVQNISYCLVRLSPSYLYFH